MLALFYILVLQQIGQGIVSLWEGWKWVVMVRQRVGTHAGFYAPRVAVICPCKGSEQGLEANLAALVNFDYPNYETFFVLASALDPARTVIDKVSSSSKQKTAHTVIAGSPKGCGEKVNNLRAAVSEAGGKFDVLVFVDSDGRLGRAWLSHMVAPLADPSLGAATTYRWYFPNKGGFASYLLSAWNAAVATQLGDHGRNFCWGGGTAVRREMFERARVVEAWEGAVSDDWALTNALERAGLRILFVPECLAPTVGDVTAEQLVEFTNRQMILTRVYAPSRWGWAGLAHLSYCVTLAYAAFEILARMFGGFSWAGMLLLALLIVLLSAAKGGLRGIAVQDVLPEWRTKCDQTSWVWIAFAPVVPVLFLWNFAISAYERRIRWRGINYELVSQTQTRVLSH
ncbi:MAG TPA: glycosyltransferase [Candidatus Acidoferrales bacterium]|nr:glycosyltransferase [Candidatus Acidoferrales bacterium]